MPNHHPQTSHPEGPPPTARQQRYMRQLALQRGVSFTIPRTRAEASRVIDQLKRRRPEPAADRRREIRAVQDDMARGRGDSSRVVEGVETIGYGHSDLEGALVTATVQPSAGATNDRVELGRYAISAGERIVCGHRVLGVVRLVDVPADDHGRRYLIERELTVMTELEAIVADYLDQAARWDSIPAAGPRLPGRPLRGGGQNSDEALVASRFLSGHAARPDHPINE
jgi:hypothetical protein